jgi:hypothetical protein
VCGQKPYWVLREADRCSTYFPKGIAVGQDLAGGESQRWLGNTSHGESRMDRRLRLAKKKGRPLAQDPYLGGGGELGTARKGQGKVGSAAGGGQG